MTFHMPYDAKLIEKSDDYFNEAIIALSRLNLIYLNNNIGLGHQRLSIIDLSAFAKQPLSNASDNIWIVFNGEIYNYKGLAKEYNILLNTNSDCEIIPHLYNLMGIQCIKLLDGVFTFIFA